MRGFFLLFLVSFFAGCSLKTPTHNELNSRALSLALQSLSSSVSKEDAQNVANLSYKVSKELNNKFQRSSSPMFHNFLVNIGLKSNGLCYEYANELLEALRVLGPKSLNIYSVVSKKGEYFEHNALLVTSKEELNNGVILDPWRSANPLFWIDLSKDRYNWRVVKKQQKD
ncbi:MAG: hypothetical protein ACOCP1_03195 [Campylobacterales bacterium]